MIALEIIGWGFLGLLAIGIINAAYDGFVESGERIRRDLQDHIDNPPPEPPPAATVSWLLCFIVITITIVACFLIYNNLTHH
jgi:hypothetical protein